MSDIEELFEELAKKYPDYVKFIIITIKDWQKLKNKYGV